MSEIAGVPALSALMAALGVTFCDPALLDQALVHRSYVNENADVTRDNERLEFLGDAVLDFVVGAYLFRRFPDLPEGELTALRAALVRAEALAQLARQVTIDRHLRLGIGEDDSGGRDKDATLSAAFEAVIGALYLDQGIAAVTPLVERLAVPLLETIQAQALHKDAKSEFQVWAQARFGITPHYELTREEGPDHARQFTMRVLVGVTAWGEGSGPSKRRAAQAAAAAALVQVQANAAAADA